MTYLSRTDFVIQLIWKPPAKDALPKDTADERTKIEELAKKLQEAQSKTKGAVTVNVEQLEKESLDESRKIEEKVIKAIQSAAQDAAAGSTPGATPATTPPPATAPAATPPQP
jgi:hypothetical protein